MQNLTLELLLDYVLNRFLLVFFICLIGACGKDIVSTVTKLAPINLKRILVSTFFSATLVCAVFEYVELEIGTSILICFCTGVWSFKLLEFLMDWEVVSTLLKNIFKNTKTVVGKSFSETMEELNKNDPSDEKPENTSDDNKNETKKEEDEGS